MKLAKFGQVPPGTRFRYNGCVYEKLSMNLAQTEQHIAFIFPSEIDIEAFEGNEALKNKPPGVPKAPPIDPNMPRPSGRDHS